MYDFIKSVVLRCFPKTFILRCEPLFRNLYALFYAGCRFQCPVCETGLRKFIKISDRERLCPKCGSAQQALV